MFRTLQIYFLLLPYFTLLKCEIPELTVRKVDSRIIEKKRQDTLEMCRLFTEENNLQMIQDNTVTSKIKESNRRFKRNIESPYDNPSLKKEDIIKVESIVSKIYDDLQEEGQNVTYRQRNLENLTTTEAVPGNQSNRRYDFAPAKLYRGLLTDVTDVTDVTNKPRILAAQEEDHSTNTFSNTDWKKKWKHGIIPYFIDPKTYDNYLMERIINAFDYIEKATCIRLQRLRVKPLDKNSLENAEWLYITNPSGIRQCVHSNERKPNLGVQMVVFGYECMSLGEIAHEIMHVLGFSHEHTRADRDQHITIHWDNIKPGYKKYFSIQEDNTLLYLPYDYASILHYPPRAFSQNGQVTISSGTKIGQREALSEIDIEKIGIIFGIDCIKRNKDYLMKTCPSVIKTPKEDKAAGPQEIKDYFKDRIWPYGIVVYKFKDDVEFSTEEKLNIKAVIDHIEKETCIQFRDDTESDEKENIARNNIGYKSGNAQNHSRKMTRASGGEIQTLQDLVDTEEVPDRAQNLVTEDHFGDIHKLNKNVQKHEKPIAHAKQGSEDTLVKRRHAANVLVLTRSSEPGCQCPESGRPNGDKAVKINRDCFNSVNDLLHFFVHILGLDHQHSMYDRDSYIQIVWDRLTPELKSDMEKKYPPAASVGFDYDYQSVMHFPWLEIKDGVTNIMYPIWNDGWGMGHWQGLSVTDVRKLNRIYEQECTARKKETI